MGNIFTAGSVDLMVDSEQHYNGNVCTNVATSGEPIYQWVGESSYPVPGTLCNGTWESKDLTIEKFFNFDDLKPGDYGENTISLTVHDNDSYLCAYVENLENNDNGILEPESIVDSTDGIGGGELQDNIFITIWRDTDCDNIYDEGTPAVAEIPGYCRYLQDPSVDACRGSNTEEECISYADYGCGWIDAIPEVPAILAEEVLVSNVPINGNNGVWSLDQLKGGEKTCIGVSWEIPEETGNVIQTDSLSGDIRFYVEQVRNNPNFVCPGIVDFCYTPGQSVFASTVLSYNQGPQQNSLPVAAARSVPEQGLVYDAAEAESSFFSLGFDGWMIVAFDDIFVDGPGVDDLKITEDTWGSPYPLEKADVFISQDGVNWTLLGVADNTNLDLIHTITVFDLADVGMDWAKYVKIVDTSELSAFDGYPTADGYDLNAVEALSPGYLGPCNPTTAN